MKVAITYDGGHVVMVNVPTWNRELFQSDPETYLEPILHDMEHPSWEVVE